MLDNLDPMDNPVLMVRQDLKDSRDHLVPREHRVRRVNRVPRVKQDL